MKLKKIMQYKVGNKTHINLISGIIYSNVFKLNNGFNLIIEKFPKNTKQHIEVYSFFNANNRLENYEDIPSRSKYFILVDNTKSLLKFRALENRINGIFDFKNYPGFMYIKKDSLSSSRNKAIIIKNLGDNIEEISYEDSKIHKIGMSAFRFSKNLNLIIENRTKEINDLNKSLHNHHKEEINRDLHKKEINYERHKEINNSLILFDINISCIVLVLLLSSLYLN